MYWAWLQRTLVYEGFEALVNLELLLNTIYVTYKYASFFWVNPCFYFLILSNCLVEVFWFSQITTLPSFQRLLRFNFQLNPGLQRVPSLPGFNLCWSNWKFKQKSLRKLGSLVFEQSFFINKAKLYFTKFLFCKINFCVFEIEVSNTLRVKLASGLSIKKLYRHTR